MFEHNIVQLVSKKNVDIRQHNKTISTTTTTSFLTRTLSKYTRTYSKKV
jgi:hypothetical protein